MSMRLLPAAIAATIAVAAPAGALADRGICDRDGYTCRAEGVPAPDLDGSTRTWDWVLYKDGYRIDLRRHDFARGRYVYAYTANNRTYAWVDIGGASTGYLDADCDGSFEVEIAAGGAFTVPACAGTPQVADEPDAHCALPGYECRKEGFELPREVSGYRELPIRLYLRRLGTEREQGHLVEGNAVRKSMCGHRVGRESLVRVAGDGDRIRLIRYMVGNRAWCVTVIAASGATTTLVDSDGDGDFDTRTSDGTVIPCPDHLEAS